MIPSIDTFDVDLEYSASSSTTDETSPTAVRTRSSSPGVATAAIETTYDDDDATIDYNDVVYSYPVAAMTSDVAFFPS